MVVVGGGVEVVAAGMMGVRDERRRDEWEERSVMRDSAVSSKALGRCLLAIEAGVKGLEKKCSFLKHFVNALSIAPMRESD